MIAIHKQNLNRINRIEFEKFLKIKKVTKSQKHTTETQGLDYFQGGFTLRVAVLKENSIEFFFKNS